MIVSCPSCHTRYRHDPGPAVKAETAECSQCEETFSLGSPKRPYVLIPREPVSVTALDGTDATATSRSAEAPGVAADPDASPTGVGRNWWRSEPFEIGIALAPSALGGVLAYYLAGQQNQDPVTWSAMGAAAGLLLGWLGLIWMQRTR